MSRFDLTRVVSSDDETEPLTTSRRSCSSDRSDSDHSGGSPHDAVGGAARRSSAIRSKVRLRHGKLVMATIFTLSLGMVIHGYLDEVEDGDAVTSLYVIMQIVTTVGYGDITPETQEMRFFMSFYILLLMILAAYAVNLLTERIITASTDSLERKLLSMEGKFQEGEDATTRTTHNQLLIATGLFALVMFAGTVFYRFAEHCSCSYGFTRVQNASCPSIRTAVEFDLCQASGGEVKTWVDAFYMAIVTSTTVGFGDVTPQTYWGRIFCIFWMILSVGTTGLFISTLSQSLFLLDDEERHWVPEGAEDIDKAIFDEIDEEGNGALSRAEYYVYVLLKHGLVSKEVMDALKRRFDSFDMDQSGGATWEEMCRARKLSKTRSKTAET